MAFKFLGQRQLGKLPSRWVSTILMVAIIYITACRPLPLFRPGNGKPPAGPDLHQPQQLHLCEGRQHRRDGQAAF